MMCLPPKQMIDGFVQVADESMNFPASLVL